jgi:hypothetical protein
MSTTDRVRTYIGQLPVGEPFTTASLLGLGSRAAVDQALRRLKICGYVQSIGRGIYVRPQINRFTGPITPEPSRIAAAVARSTGAIIQPHGAEAARLFGLTTQVPTQPVFNTTGPSRHIKVGNLLITLRRTTTRKLALDGRAGLALAALLYLGKEGVTGPTLDTVCQQLTLVEFEQLCGATCTMPGWLADRVYRYKTRHQQRA